VYSIMASEFPSAEAPIWHQFQSASENRKLQSNDFYAIPKNLRKIIYEFNGPAFVRFLERLTGIDNIIPGPHLYGGGLHQSRSGAHLSMHIDYNYHEAWGLDRRLNVILYFNDDWEEAWGGHLELWNKDMTTLVKKIAPLGNRLVIFNTDEFSWHGHPDPLRCPESRTRRSMAFYYYTNGRPKTESAAPHNTVFRERPGEAFVLNFKERLREWVPPAAIKLARRLSKSRT